MTEAKVTMDEVQEESGRAAVRAHLVEPLARLPRPRGVAAAAHEKALSGLVDYLSYMDASTLRGLCEMVLRQSMTANGPRCPDPSIVRAWAYHLAAPPPRHSDYAGSLVRSALGRRAREEGWLIELFQIARKLGPPPGQYIITRLRDEAADNARRASRIAQRIAIGAASDDDIAWLRTRDADIAECLRIITDAATPAPEVVS